MTTPNQVIIDTDPGVDDVLALLLAFSSRVEELKVLMVSVTYGNVPVDSCLKNAVAMFKVINDELTWRRERSLPLGFDTLRAHKPILSVGASHPLDEDELVADYFHGLDGLHGVHEKYPHLSPSDAWKGLFQDSNGSSNLSAEIDSVSTLFEPTRVPAPEKILQLLRENPKDTISIIVIGPMTNVALAAARDPETFLRAKELIVMAGAIDVPGNVTPVAEFNTRADPVAAARVFALTSPIPESTMPIIPSHKQTDLIPLPSYPERLSRPLKVKLFPLDITTPQLVYREHIETHLFQSEERESPLHSWVGHFIDKTLEHIEQKVGPGEDVGLSLHDPLNVLYAMTSENPAWKFSPKPEDIRIETVGQWTRGMHILDKRGYKKPGAADVALAISKGIHFLDTDIPEVPGDIMNWLSAHKGNRIYRALELHMDGVFGDFLLQRIFHPTN